MASNESCVISGFRREVDETCTLLGYYATRSVNLLPTFRDNISVPFLGSRIKILEFLTHENGIDGTSRSRQWITNIRCVISQ